MTRKKKTKSKIPPPPDLSASAAELAAYFEKYSLEELEKAGYVSELNESESAEVEEIARQAKARIDARKGRTQLNLAMSAEQLDRFIAFANRKHIPPSTLAKAWILERLDQEAKNS